MPVHEGNDISWLHHWVHEILDNPQYALFIVGAVLGWATLWMRHMFVTHKVMKGIDEKNEAAHERISIDLHRVKEDVSWMKGFMQKQHGGDD